MYRRRSLVVLGFGVLLGLPVAAAQPDPVSNAQARIAIDAERAGLDQPLTDQPGQPERGRLIVTSRQTGLCLLCHRGPFEPAAHQGTLASDLAGVGRRWTAAQLRLRIVNARRINPDSLMPPFHDTSAQHQVARAQIGQPILNAQQVEDVIAFLLTLTDETAR
jgi:sulfur-oxidizing protein SoxX